MKLDNANIMQHIPSVNKQNTRFGIDARMFARKKIFYIILA